jgi:hypothetical protein
VAAAAMVLGGLFGYLSEVWGEALCKEGSSAKEKSAV